MNTKSDWDAVRQQTMADERRRVEPPPTSEEMLAYTRGELSAEEEERVRERLVCYPELVRTMTEAFPEEDPRPGDAGYVSEEEMTRRWTEIQDRVRHNPPTGGRVLQFTRAFAALAAALAIVFGGLLWKARSDSDRPQVLEEQLLESDMRRGPGGASAVLTAEGEKVVLVVSPVGSRDFGAYRLEIRDVTATRLVWNIPVSRRGDSNSFPIVVPRKHLAPGSYQIVLYGIGAAGEEQIDTYSFRVLAR